MKFIASLLLLLSFSQPAHALIENIKPEEFEEKAQLDLCPNALFIFASWCESCKRKLEDFMTLSIEYKNVNFHLISIDNKESDLVKFLTPYSKNTKVFRIIHEDPLKLEEAFGEMGIGYVGNIPHITIANCNGEIQYDGAFKHKEIVDALDNASQLPHGYNLE